MIIRDSVYRIDKKHLTEDLTKALLIPNKDFGKRKSEPEYYEAYSEDSSGILIPRNFDISSYLSINIIDKRVDGLHVDFPEHNRPLYAHQAGVSHKVILNPRDQIIRSPCASGKTIMAINIISRLKRKAVVIVPSELLLFQWVEQVYEELGIEAGAYYSKKKDIRDITICLIHSLFRKDYGDIKGFEDVGLVIADEVHQMGAMSWSKGIKPFSAKVRIGFTATLRGDSLDSLLFWHFGEVTHHIKRKDLIRQGIILLPDILTLEYNGKDIVKPEKSAYCPVCDLTFYSRRDVCVNCKSTHVQRTYDYVGTCSAIARSEARNDIIVDAILKCLSHNRHPLIIVNRVAHVKVLQELFEKQGRTVNPLYENHKDYSKVGVADITIAMYAMSKQGLDASILDTLLIAFPLSNKGMVEQCAGRISRISSNKRKPLVMDIRDTATDMLNKMYQIRKQVYTHLGCTYRSGSTKEKI